MEGKPSFWRRLHSHFVPSKHNAYRPHSLSRDFLITIVAVVCVVEGFLFATLFLQSSGNFAAAVIKSAIISLTNVERASAGDAALVENEALRRAAQAKAEDMAARGYFSHVGPDGKEPWAWVRDAGYDYAYAGENLAVRFYDSADVVDAWMASPSHRANIVKPVYREIGIGIAEGQYEGNPTTFVVQFFGTSRAALGIGSEVETPTASPATLSEEVATPETSGEAVTASAESSPVPAIASVEGESASQVPASLVRFASSPRTLAVWVLIVTAALVLVSLMFTIFIRMHIQPVDMLFSGAAVATLILSVIAFNAYVLTGATIPDGPAAAVQSL